MYCNLTVKTSTVSPTYQWARINYNTIQLTFQLPPVYHPQLLADINNNQPVPMQVMINLGLYHIEYIRNQDQSLIMMYSSIYDPDRKYVSF